MTTEKITFYILYSLFDYYQELKRDRTLSRLSNPHNSAPIINIVFRLINKKVKIDFEDVRLALPSVIKAGFIEEVNWNNEKQYAITFDGMKQYERLAEKYPDSKIEKARKIIEELESEKADTSENDKQTILDCLYLFYSDEGLFNSILWREKFDNYQAPSTLKAMLTHQKIDVASVEQVLEKLCELKQIDRSSDASGNPLYRISSMGIYEYERLREKKTGEPPTSNKSGLYKSTPKMKPAVKSAGEIAASSQGKWFISHAVLNKALAIAFQEKILETGLRVNPDEIFNISVEGSGIESGEDFKQRIEAEIRTAKAIILLITPEYKISGACLNEMGAAWMMDGTIPVIPFILNMSHSSVGFIHNPTQHLQMDDKADLYKFVSEAKKKGLIKGDYDNGRLDRMLNEFMELTKNPAGEKTGSEPEPVKAKVAPIKAANPGTNAIRSVRAKLLKKWFREPLKTYEFYQLNNHGEYYYFENDQFHLIPNIETRHFLGWTKSRGHINLAIIDDDDLLKLTGEPIQNIFDMTRFRLPANRTCWLVYKGKRHQVMSVKLNEDLRGNAQIIDEKELHAIPLGNRFEME